MWYFASFVTVRYSNADAIDMGGVRLCGTVPAPAFSRSERWLCECFVARAYEGIKVSVYL